MFWFSKNHFEILVKSRKCHWRGLHMKSYWKSRDFQYDFQWHFPRCHFRDFWDFAQISKWFFENQNIIFFDDLKKNNVVKVMCCRFRAKKTLGFRPTDEARKQSVRRIPIFPTPALRQWDFGTHFRSSLPYGPPHSTQAPKMWM